MVQAVVFDFDLTLADSTSGAVDCVNYALQKVGLSPVDPIQIHRTIGLSIPRIFTTLTGKSDPIRFSEFSDRFIERADQVIEVLPKISDRSLRCKIATSGETDEEARAEAVQRRIEGKDCRGSGEGTAHDPGNRVPLRSSPEHGDEVEKASTRRRIGHLLQWPSTGQ